MQRQEEEELENLELHSGPVKTEENSTFMTFAAQVQSTEEVKKYYKKLKIEHCMATHVYYWSLQEFLVLIM